MSKVKNGKKPKVSLRELTLFIKALCLSGCFLFGKIKAVSENIRGDIWPVYKISLVAI